jgi:hypothetical protein
VTGIRYHLRSGGTPERPLCLLRLVPTADGGVSEQVLRRDLHWYPTGRFLVNARTGEHELVEVSEQRALEVLDAWRRGR